MSIFVEQIVDLEWGNYYELKPAGYAAFAFVMIAALLLGSFISGSMRERSFKGSGGGKSLRLSPRQLAFSAMGMALGYAASFIKVIDMPMGGSVTLFSMLFITVIGYWYGLRTGLMAAIAYGCLQLITEPYIISIPQLLIDYIFAFGALGLSGIFSGRKQGLIWGYLTGVAGRFVFTFLSGTLFFASYASEYHMAAPVYSFLYNGMYLGLEALIGVVLIAIRPVNSAFARVKQMAVGENRE